MRINYIVILPCIKTHVYRILNAALSIEHAIRMILYKLYIIIIIIISHCMYNSYTICMIMHVECCSLFFPIHFPPKRSRIFRFSLSSCDFPRVKHLLLWGRAFSPATPSSLPGTNWFQPRYPPLVSTVSTPNFQKRKGLPCKSIIPVSSTSWLLNMRHGLVMPSDLTLLSTFVTNLNSSATSLHLWEDMELMNHLSITSHTSIYHKKSRNIPSAKT